MASTEFHQSILDHVSTNRDAQLAGILLDHKPEPDPGRPDYFYLTDLTNPQQNYWEHLGEAPEDSEEKLELFAHGNRMESRVRRAFSTMDDFYEEEATIDGAETGLPGIRGKVDFRYLDSLVEFKTSVYDIDTGQDVWDKAPQDIEQLLFYNVLWGYENDTHYLIYLSENDVNALHVFKVLIKDSDALRSALESRQAALSDALELVDPSELGQCRYFDHTCEIGEEEICNCSSLHPIDTSPLQNATTISRAEDLENRIAIALRATEETPTSVNSSWYLYTPRQWFAREFFESESSGDYITPEWTERALEAAGLTSGPFSDLEPPKFEGIVRYAPRITFVERTWTSDKGTKTDWVPAKISARDDSSPPTTQALRYQFMQVACATAVAGKDKGLLILELPNSGTELVVHEVEIEEPERIRQLTEERMDLICKAVREDDPSILPECPDWLQGKDCENCLCN